MTAESFIIEAFPHLDKLTAGARPTKCEPKPENTEVVPPEVLRLVTFDGAQRVSNRNSHDHAALTDTSD
ncbi:MAG: hypothetical protein ACREIA_09955, partial [Opitutaceae bacterium]